MSAVKKRSAAQKSVNRSRGRHRRSVTPRSVLWLRAGAVAAGLGAAVAAGHGVAAAAPDSASPADAGPTGSASTPTSSTSSQPQPKAAMAAINRRPRPIPSAATAVVGSPAAGLTGRRAALAPKDTVGHTKPSGDPTTGPGAVVDTSGAEANSSPSTTIGTAGACA